ncbi:hypothetical protein HPB47_007354 [Ixodes persulcatus]|uniref:Uncharacterized protein n=1 Tax=Ixodes persulcatus TaxID=34615 RepID=A0AC60P7S8_IXOPE|nr:hypothetical protein HPB47_007354 [Ixodes persulcatus]
MGALIRSAADETRTGTPHSKTMCPWGFGGCYGDDSASKETIPRLTDVDWDMLEQLWEALRPLLGVTELIGGDEYVTRSVLIPVIRLLKNKIKINNCDTTFICRLKAILVDSVDERLSAWLRYNDYEMATCLNPWFKSLVCIDKDRREHITQKKERKYAFSEESEEATVACQASLCRSLPELTGDDLDPLLWWRAQGSLLPELGPIVKRVMCVLASSTLCERLYSAAGMIVNKETRSCGEWGQTSLSSELEPKFLSF